MKSVQPVHRASKRDYWKRIINEWEHSGCSTQAGFCRKADVSTKSFSRWRSVFAREQLQHPSQVSFAKVEVQTTRPAGSGIRIALSHHAHIDISPDFDEATLRRVLSVCI